MAKRANTIQNLIDMEVWGDITLQNPKFLDDNNVITKAFLETSFDEFKKDLVRELPPNLKQLIENDEEVIAILKRALIKFITTNVEVKGSLKDYIIELIVSDIDTQNHIKSHISWLVID